MRKLEDTDATFTPWPVARGGRRRRGTRRCTGRRGTSHVVVPRLHSDRLPLHVRRQTDPRLCPGHRANGASHADREGNRITHLHGVGGFDYKQYYQLCPNFLVETTGGGTVDTKPDLGGSYAFLDPNWHPKGRYVTPEPAVPPAKVTSHTTKPNQNCDSVSQTDRATFELGYVPVLSGYTRAARRVAGSLTRKHQGYNACHPFSPLPPPPPEDVSCSWRLRWTLVGGR